MKYILISIVIFFNIGSHTLFKYASTEIFNLNLITLISNWKIILGMFFQFIALLTWIKLLQNVELYWASLMTALIPLVLVCVSIFIFNETISALKILGGLLIIIGLYIING